MKKRYLITFLFLLFFNINTSYAHTCDKNLCIVNTGYNKEEFKVLYNNICSGDTTKCYSICIGQTTTTKIFHESNVVDGTDDSFSKCNGYYSMGKVNKDYFSSDYGQVNYFVVGGGKMSSLEIGLEGKQCGDVSCADYLQNTYCKDYKNRKTNDKQKKYYEELCKQYDLTYIEDTPAIIDKNKQTKLDCVSLFESDEYGKELKKMIKGFINIVKFFVPIALIGLGMLDFAKAIFSNSEDAIKKAQKKFIRRMIIGVCIFLIPTIIKFVLTIGSMVWPNISPDFCGLI